jgi:putative aminopeptidase FrvX
MGKSMSKRWLSLFALLILLPTELVIAEDGIPAPVDTLRKFAETPGVSGYESVLAKEIQKHLAALKLESKTDNLGSVIVKLGSGEPTQVIAAPIDEVGYIVSAITEDRFLRVQRLLQGQQFAFFDTLLTAQPVSIFTKAGQAPSGIVAVAAREWSVQGRVQVSRKRKVLAVPSYLVDSISLIRKLGARKNFYSNAGYLP